MNWASPKLLIAIMAIVGLMIGGITGLFLGLVGGFALTLVMGVLVNMAQGGAIPKRARRDLVKNIIVNYPEDVRAAFPGLTGNELFASVEQVLERVVREAVRFAPTHETILYQGPMYRAIDKLIMEETDSSRAALLRDVREQLTMDWFSPSITGI